ncbi:MAG: glycosyltransferase family 4 protein [Planctomycetota bacterium]|jgi:glycosyltransferase involved in cell wall biosynthesis
MKICITSPIFPPDLGGPAIYVPSLARYLVSQGHQVKVIAFCETQEHEGYPFEVVTIPRCWLPFRYVKSFLSVLRHARDCDMIYINEHLALVVALAGRILGKPMVIRICVDGTWEISHRLGWHRDSITDYVKRKYGFKVWWARRLQLLWWSWVRYIIAPSRFLEGIALDYGVPPQKVRQINNAYHGPEEDGISREDARAKLGIPEGEKMILTICRLMIWKGVDGIIRAIKEMPEDHKLYVVGDGDQMENWQGLSQDMGLSDRVFFKGNVPYELIPYYLKAADVFVLNSNYEGLSHTILEVMWSGLPAVVTGVCGNPELIEDGVNGLTIPFNRPEKLHQAIMTILNDSDLASMYSEASREKVKDFARTKIFQETEALFKQAVGRI